MSSNGDGRQRRIVVTGAAQGVGRGCVERFLGEGHSVLGIDINGEKLAEIEPLGADALVADLADPEGRRTVIEASAGCDGLVNSAGIILLKNLRDITVEEWRWLVQVNVESIFFLCQGIGPTMVPGGAIVNLDKVLAEVAPLRGMTPDELSEARTQVVPLKRGSTPAEISGLISFLLGPDSAYITGQAINHTGGLVMW